MFSVSQPQSPEEFEKYYALRYEVLRKLWNQPIGSERDEQENESIHAYIVENNEVLAVCRLQMNDETTAQIRYMGVRDDMQGKGLGRKIIQYMEQVAHEKKAKKIILHARENAVEFYKSCGYSIVEKSYILFNKIQI